MVTWKSDTFATGATLPQRSSGATRAVGVAILALVMSSLPSSGQDVSGGNAADRCMQLVADEAVSLFAINQSGDAAEEACRVASLADPANVDLKNRWGLALWAAGQTGNAVSQFRGSAELGSPVGQHFLSLMLFFGTGADKDLTTSREMMQSAAEAGNISAKVNVAMAMIDDFFGDGVRTEEGMAILAELASAGHPLAKSRLGSVYLFGVPGVASDPTKGIALLREAAEAGHHESMAYLAQEYAQGKNIEKSDEQSFAWNLKAAEGGQGLFNLAWHYAFGKGTQQSPTEAAIWLLAEALKEDSFFLEPAQISIFPAPVNRSVQEFLRDNGFYNGRITDAFSPQAISALHRWRLEAHKPAFQSMADAFRAKRKKQAELFVGAIEKAVSANAAKRAAENAVKAERVAIDHPPSEELSPEWREFIAKVRAPNADAELNKFKKGMIGEIDKAWVNIVAVEPETSTIYYFRANSGNLYANDARSLTQPNLPPVGDHSGSGEELLINRPWDPDDATWKQWTSNISYAFRRYEHPVFKSGDRAHLSGFLGDMPIGILEYDEKRQQFYYIREDNLYLYRVGSDHVITRAASAQRDLGRGAAALGLAYCIMSGNCTE